MGAPCAQSRAWVQGGQYSPGVFLDWHLFSSQKLEVESQGTLASPLATVFRSESFIQELYNTSVLLTSTSTKVLPPIPVQTRHTVLCKNPTDRQQSPVTGDSGVTQGTPGRAEQSGHSHSHPRLQSHFFPRLRVSSVPYQCPRELAEFLEPMVE